MKKTTESSLQAIQALEKFPTPATRQALIDMINHSECFYKVRLEACHCLAKVRIVICGECVCV